VSFLGHLCGIGAGLLYVKGPLKPVVEIPTKIVEDVLLGYHVPAPNPGRFVEYQGPLNNDHNNNPVGNIFGGAPQIQNNNYYQPQGGQNHNAYYNNNDNNAQFPGETPAQRAARLRNINYRNY
jgi:hypothetical protein